MRNEWFPQKKAEYMTIARFAELGLTKSDVGEPDPAFAIRPALEDAEEGESAIGERLLEMHRVPVSPDMHGPLAQRISLTKCN
jgi:hypothetical protein